MCFDISTILVYLDFYRPLSFDGLWAGELFRAGELQGDKRESFFIAFWVGGLRLQFKDRTHTNGVLYTKLLAQA